MKKRKETIEEKIVIGLNKIIYEDLEEFQMSEIEKDDTVDANILHGLYVITYYDNNMRNLYEFNVFLNGIINKGQTKPMYYLKLTADDMLPGYIKSRIRYVQVKFAGSNFTERKYLYTLLPKFKREEI